ncbi:MAG: hypothetical protein FJX02_08215 [Alphaproteobacteria bacterium]|nr:hypothetical protein [Alphaproteobacteria bacterium]
MANPKIPTVSPYLTVRGGKAAIAFYKKAFGAKTLMLMMAVKSLPIVTPFSRPIPTPLGGQEWAYPRSA